MCAAAVRYPPSCVSMSCVRVALAIFKENELRISKFQSLEEVMVSMREISSHQVTQMDRRTDRQTDRQTDSESFADSGQPPLPAG